jgi:RNA polymerase sigma-70 factor (ECF subfamily)
METAVSLLERLRDAPDEKSWERLVAIYRPYVYHWLLRDPRLRNDAEDLTQEVLQVLVAEISSFEHRGRGTFRQWLRQIVVNRILTFLKKRQQQTKALGIAAEECCLDQLSDPDSALSLQWEREHDHYVLGRLLELVQPMFKPKTLAAFRKTALENIEPAQVATELGMTVGAVLIAKSRVLSRLRAEVMGLID